MQVSARKLLFTIILIAICGCLQAADDALMGAWSLNVKKSKFTPGPVPKSSTYIYQPNGSGGLMFISDGVTAAGAATHVEYTADYDGKDYPVKGDPSRDMVSLKRVSPSTTEETNKKGGTVTSTVQLVVSSNGKSLTITSKGTNAQGQPFNNVGVYDKE